MKIVSRPSWLVLVAVIMAALLLLSSWRLRVENAALRARRSAQPASTPASTPQKTRSAPTDDTPAMQAQLADLREQLLRESATRTAAEIQAAQLAARLPIQEGEVVVSFGRIEQMSRTSAELLRIQVAELGRKPGAAPPSPDERIKMQEAFVRHFEQIPELRRMEDEPQDMARFQTAMLSEFYRLDAAAASRVTTLLETEFARLRELSLTALHRPASDPAEWDRRRDAAVTDLAKRVRPLLPANAAHLELLPGMLNLGAGPRTTIKVNTTGKDTVLMSFPLFPTTPR